jgi:rubrerythrin
MIDIEVLRLASSKEEEAIKTYKDLLKGHPNLKELLYFLIGEEQKHKILIENKIAELTKY